MDINPMLKYYDMIVHAESQEEIHELEMLVKAAVLNNELIDDKDITIINLTLNVKMLQFMFEELATATREPTIIVMGGDDWEDPEEAQLAMFHEQEYEEFKDGNVVPIKDFTKKKDE
ncbi:MAG: hypothetical protein KAQ85_01395 [Thermodesulfovibrionia bacterium]|nr:hypothetical protein [Thermodesulfovibrionia bacterium]